MALVVKNALANAGDVRDVGSIPGLERFSWRRAWQPAAVFLPGDSPWTEEPWRATIHRSAKSQTRLNQLSTHSRTGLIMHWNG